MITAVLPSLFAPSLPEIPAVPSERKILMPAPQFTYDYTDCPYRHKFNLIYSIKLIQSEYHKGINFRGINFRGNKLSRFFLNSRKFVPAKCFQNSHPRKFVPAKFNIFSKFVNTYIKTRKFDLKFF